MERLTINGAKYAYEEAGEGSPLLLLHAGIADMRMWDDVWEAFTAGHRVLRLDLRGFGETPLPDGPFVYAADAAALLAELGIQRAHVVGVSMGGGVAMDLAIARPELVDRLVLSGAGVSGWEFGEGMDAFDRDETAALERGDLDEASWINVRHWIDGPQRGPEAVDATLRARVFEMQRRAFELDNEAAQGGWLVEDRHLKLGEIGSPTLVVVGELDQPDMLAMAGHLAGQIPDARLEVMDGVAHLPPMEDPGAFRRLVLGFLAD